MSHHSVNYISDNQSLQDICLLLQDVEQIAVDTEFLRRKTFFPQAALFQIAVPDAVFIIDPLEISEWQPLCDILLDENIIKIMHACWEDIEVFNHFLGVIPVNVMDTQLALAFCNIGWSMGYHAMVESLMNISLSKEATMTDWLQRPLTQEQLIYAEEDVTYLLQCFDLLKEKLHEEAKWEYFIQQNDVLKLKFEDSLLASNAYARIKSFSQLNHQKQMLLHALCEWRELKVQVKNIPRSWLVDDKALMMIVDNIKGLTDGRLMEKLSAGRKTKTFAAEIIALLEQKLTTSVDNWPEFKPAKLRIPKKHPALAWRSMAERLEGELNISAQLILSKDEFMTGLKEVEIDPKKAEDSDDVQYEFVAPVDWVQWKQKLVAPEIQAWLTSFPSSADSNTAHQERDEIVNS